MARSWLLGRKVGGWRIWRMGTRTSVEVREPLGACARPARPPDSQYGVSRGGGLGMARRWLLVAESSGWRIWRMVISYLSRSPRPLGACARRRDHRRHQGPRPLETRNCGVEGRAASRKLQGAATFDWVRVPMRQIAEPLLSHTNTTARPSRPRTSRDPYASREVAPSSRKAPSGSRTSTEVRNNHAPNAPTVLSAHQQPPARHAKGLDLSRPRIASREVAPPRARLRVARGLRLRSEYPCAKCANRLLSEPQTTTCAAMSRASDLSRPRIATSAESRRPRARLRGARGLRLRSEVPMRQMRNRYFPPTNNHLRGHVKGLRPLETPIAIGRSRRLAQGSEGLAT